MTYDATPTLRIADQTFVGVAFPARPFIFLVN
jgi:hypothetical protein